MDESSFLCLRQATTATIIAETAPVIPLTVQNLTKNHLRENHCIEHLSIYLLNNAFTYNTAPITGAVLVNYPRFQDVQKESLL